MSLDLSVDPLALDSAWGSQPEQVGIWARKLAEFQSDLDVAKSALELAEATIANDMRSGNAKVSAAAIKQEIPLRQLYIDGVGNVNRLKKSVAIVKAALTSLESKEKALSKLTDLYIHDYYAETRNTMGESDADRMRRTREKKEARDAGN